MITSKKCAFLVETMDHQEDRARKAAKAAVDEKNFDQLLTAFEIAIAGLASSSIILRKLASLPLSDDDYTRTVLAALKKGGIK